MIRFLKVKISTAMLYFLFVAFLQCCMASDKISDNRLLSDLAPQVPSTAEVIREKLPQGWPEHGVLVFPEAARKPWTDAISSAKQSIQMAAYRLSDEIIVKALIDAKGKGIDIEVLIEPFTFQHDKSSNETSPIERLKQSGIKVYTLSKRFNQAHYKMILIDGNWGMVGTGNLDKDSFDGLKEVTAAPCRDFAITVTDLAMVQELSRIFKADIADKRVWSNHSQLVWGPDTQRAIFLQMATCAQKSIRIYQQDFQDVGFAQAIAGAARDGVKVEVVMMPYPFSKTKDNNTPNQDLIRQAGGKVYLHHHHYIHAKVMIVDEDNPTNRLMYIGSCNFYTPSLDQTRELGILTSNLEQIKQVSAIFDKDRQQVQ